MGNGVTKNSAKYELLSAIINKMWRAMTDCGENAWKKSGESGEQRNVTGSGKQYAATIMRSVIAIYQ